MARRAKVRTQVRGFDTLMANARAYEQRAMNWPYQIAQAYAPRGEADMKQERKWIDRTGNARSALAGHAVSLSPGVAAIVFVHGMEYGKYLELAMQGRYAIVKPIAERYYSVLQREIGFR